MSIESVKGGRVYRFRGLVAFHTDGPDGCSTQYLTAEQAKAFADFLAQAAADIETVKFVESTLPTQQF